MPVEEPSGLWAVGSGAGEMSVRRESSRAIRILQLKLWYR